MRLLETDTASNANISSAYASGVYTADAARHIVCRLFVDQAAGAGDYVGYLTVQRAGSGSSYVMLPKTTATAASGETAIGLVSIGLPVSTGDVVTAYIDGLAGDTTTPDIACEWFEVDTLRPTTADRTLDVSAGGEAGIDWANVGSPTTAVNLSATNIDVDQVVASVSGAVGSVTGAVGSVTGNVGGNVVGSVGSVSGAVGSVTGNVGGNVAGSVGSVTGSVGSVAAGGITASSIAADAIGAAELATDACQKIADVALRRTMASIEASSNGETLSVESLYGLIAAAFEASLASTTLTVRKSDGSTLGTKTLTTDASAAPVTGIT